MKVRCSVGLYPDPIEAEDCLKCSLDLVMPPCGYGYRLLATLFASENDRSNEIHVTDITGCLLKAYLDKRFPTPEFVHHKLVRWLGTAVHDGLLRTDEHFQAEVPVGNEFLMGRADTIYNNNDIEDVKTVRWYKPSNGIYGNHAHQVNIYRHLARKEGKLRIQYIDLSGPTRCSKCKVPVEMIDCVLQCPRCGYAPRDAHLGAMQVEVLVMDADEVEDFIRSRTEILRNALESGIPPEAEPDWLCYYCPHACEYSYNPQNSRGE